MYDKQKKKIVFLYRLRELPGQLRRGQLLLLQQGRRRLVLRAQRLLLRARQRQLVLQHRGLGHDGGLGLTGRGGAFVRLMVHANQGCLVHGAIVRRGAQIAR
jgi:hypothetical protein